MKIEKFTSSLLSTVSVALAAAGCGYGKHSATSERSSAEISNANATLNHANGKAAPENSNGNPCARSIPLTDLIRWGNCYKIGNNDLGIVRRTNNDSNSSASELIEKLKGRLACYLDVERLTFRIHDSTTIIIEPKHGDNYYSGNITLTNQNGVMVVTGITRVWDKHEPDINQPKSITHPVVKKDPTSVESSWHNFSAFLGLERPEENWWRTYLELPEVRGEIIGENIPFKQSTERCDEELKSNKEINLILKDLYAICCKEYTPFESLMGIAPKQFVFNVMANHFTMRPGGGCLGEKLPELVVLSDLLRECYAIPMKRYIESGHNNDLITLRKQHIETGKRKVEQAIKSLLQNEVYRKYELSPCGLKSSDSEPRFEFDSESGCESDSESRFESSKLKR